MKQTKRRRIKRCKAIRRRKYLAIALASSAHFSDWLFRLIALCTATKQIESIAVMPFVNESGNADVEYLERRNDRNAYQQSVKFAESECQTAFSRSFATKAKTRIYRRLLKS
ncbi:MAG: hypothetical protein WKF71_13605 [Pyrinomonadaceae bacterium]